MAANQGRIPTGSRWRFPGRARPRGHIRGLELDERGTAIPAPQVCPVTMRQAEASVVGDLALLPGGRSVPDDGPSVLDILIVRAQRFITMFHDEQRLGPPGQRLRQVRREIETTGTYWHTPEELAFGARVAWRNSYRCIGRLSWQSLRVRDCRKVTAAAGVAAESFRHLREATNGGRIRPMITVFAPDAPRRPGPRIVSSQLVRYAGYQGADGAITGDPINADLTRLAYDSGWPGRQPEGRFDVLPLLVQEAGAPVTAHEIPASAVLEVRLEHPEFRWFAGLGLRWYAVPVISDMCLDIGGVRYPAAPFNGWHTCTEIGSRDLGDGGRYDQLPVIAARMGLCTVGDPNLWQDKAMTELHLAVLHSFTAAGVTVTDQRTEPVRFLPPVSHRGHQDFGPAPSLYRHPVGWPSRAHA